MILRTLSRLSIVCFGLAGSTRAADEIADAQNPGPRPLYQAVRQVVLKHYPRATAHLFKDKSRFEHATRLYLARAIIKSPRPPIIEVRGPKRNGVWCNIVFHKRVEP